MKELPGQDPAKHLPLAPSKFYVLLSLAGGDKHGYAILKDVKAQTRGNLQISVSTLYGIIQQLEAQQLITERLGALPWAPAASQPAEPLEPTRFPHCAAASSAPPNAHHHTLTTTKRMSITLVRVGPVTIN